METKSKVYEDVVFIAIKDNKEVQNIKINKDYPIPVQLKDKEISAEKGINFEAIVAGLIIVIAEGPDSLKYIQIMKNLDYDQAFEYYKELLLKLQPDAVKTLSLAGIARTNAEDFTFARQLLKTVINLTHSDISYINLATMYAKECVKYKDDKIKSEIADENLFKTLHEGLKNNSDSLSIKAELGAYHLRHKDLDVSYDYFKEFVEQAEDGDRKTEIKNIVDNLKEIINDDNIVYAAYDQIMLQNFDKALIMLDKYQKEHSDAWDGWFLRGWALRCQEKFELAKKSLLTSLEKDFNKSETYNELSLCCKALNETDLAKEYLNIATELDEKNVIYLANLAFLYLKDKEFDQAKYFLEKARALDENDPQVLALIEEWETITKEKLGPTIKEEYIDIKQIEEITKELEEKGQPVKEI